MVTTNKPSHFSEAALQHRLELGGKSGPKAILHNLRIFGVVTFACIGGLLQVSPPSIPCSKISEVVARCFQARRTG